MHIDSYSFGKMVIDGVEHRNDLFIYGGVVFGDWWRKEGHNLRVEDIEEVVLYKPEVIVIGRGASGVMRVSKEAVKYIESNGIELSMGKTGAAVEMFNKAIADGVNAAGAFHLTC
jgi:hypothetical protein